MLTIYTGTLRPFISLLIGKHEKVHFQTYYLSPVIPKTPANLRYSSSEIQIPSEEIIVTIQHKSRDRQ